MRRGLTLTAFDIDALIDKSDLKLIRQAVNPGLTVCTISSPQKKKPLHIDLTSFVRGSIHICFSLFNICSLKIVISIGVYSNMYSLPLLTLRYVSLVFTHSPPSLK